MTLPVSIDFAINRLGEIQKQEKLLSKEKAQLRKETKGAMLEAKVTTHTTTLGYTATTFDKVAQKADKKYILSQLDEDQQLLAYTIVTSKELKIS